MHASGAHTLTTSAPASAARYFHNPPASKLEHFCFFLLFAGLCSLFTGLQLHTSFIIIKPFDVICVLTVPLLILLSISRGFFPRSLGLLFLLIFFFLDVASAWTVSTKNGLREAVQMTELSILAIAFTLYRSQLDWGRMAHYFLVVAFFITCFNVYWHVSHGFYFGWKRLDEPKFLFSYGLPVLFSLLLLGRRRAGPLDYVLLLVIAFLLVLSGERKAQIGLLLCVLIFVLIGYLRIGPLLAGSWMAAVVLSAIVASNSYLSIQLHSLSTLGEAAQATIGELKTPDPELSLSNAQRGFANQISADLISQHLIWGVGTSAYFPYVKATYSDYPRYLLIEIHNEFQRILVENGLVGLISYLLPWIRSALYGISFYLYAGRRAAAMYSFFFIIIFLQCFFEGGGNEAFIAFVAVALLPDFFVASGVLRRFRMERVTSTATAAGSLGPASLRQPAPFASGVLPLQQTAAFDFEP